MLKKSVFSKHVFICHVFNPTNVFYLVFLYSKQLFYFEKVQLFFFWGFLVATSKKNKQHKKETQHQSSCSRSLPSVPASILEMLTFVFVVYRREHLHSVFSLTAAWQTWHCVQKAGKEVLASITPVAVYTSTLPTVWEDKTS